MRRSVRKLRGQRCLRRCGHEVSHAPPSAGDCVRYWHGATGRTPVSRSAGHAADPTQALQQNNGSGTDRRSAGKHPSKRCCAEAISIYQGANRGSELSNSGGTQDATGATLIGCSDPGRDLAFQRDERWWHFGNQANVRRASCTNTL